MALMIKRAFLIKREAVPGTAETLLAADGIGDFIELGLVTPDLKRMDTNNQIQQEHGHAKSQHDEGAASLPITGTVPVRRAAAPGSKPDISEILAGLCGLAEAVTAGTKVVYTPQTPDDPYAHAAASTAQYEGDKLYLGVAARGNFTLSGQQGQRLQLAFDGKAPFTRPTTGNTAPTVAKPTAQAMAFSGAVAVTEDGSAIRVGSLEFSPNFEIVEQPNSDGVAILVVQNKPTVKINPNAVANQMEWDKLLDATSIAIKATWTGLVLDCPTCQLAEAPPADRDGIIAHEKVFECLGGDSSFSLEFN